MKGQVMLLVRLYQHMGRYRIHFYLSLLLVCLGAIVNAFIPLSIGIVIDYFTSNIRFENERVVSMVDFQYVAFLLTRVGILFAVGQGSIYFSNRLIAAVVQHAMMVVRNEISEKMNRLPMAYFDRQQQGNILSRITNDIDNISNTLQQGLLPIVTSVISIIAVIIVLTFVSWQIMLLSMLIIPASALITRKIIQASQKYFEQLQAALGQLNGFIQEDYSSFELIQLYGREAISTAEFAEIHHTITSVSFKSNMISSLTMPLCNIITNCVYMGVALLGGYYTITGMMTLGVLQSCTQYVWQLNSPVSQITQLVPGVQSCFAAMHRVFEILDEPEEQQEVVTQELPSVIEGHIDFEHVQFGYDADKLLMTNLNLSIAKGQMIAIVGPTGAGKTTLVNLLLRFYEINGGKIHVDNIATCDLTRQQLRSLFGMVLQDTWLYHGTVADNIRFGKLDATQSEIEQAAKVVKIHEYIEQLPEGYQTLLNEETSNISQGQKQLLTLARTILSDPKILILDEATSSIDTRLELLIQQAMKIVMEGRTSFVIAHRLSTIKEADVILVIREGDIIEQGTHQELLAYQGFYAELYKSQFAGTD